MEREHEFDGSHCELPKSQFRAIFVVVVRQRATNKNAKNIPMLTRYHFSIMFSIKPLLGVEAGWQWAQSIPS